MAGISNYEVTFEASGKLFPVLTGTWPGLDKPIRAGIFDIAAEITTDVQEQLVAGHGWVTGRLRGSIGARQFSNLGYEVRSGAVTGEPVPYAYWIETGKRRGRQTRFRGYQMFGRAAKKWNSNRARIDKIMADHVLGAMQ
jgi:hypothetical protein